MIWISDNIGIETMFLRLLKLSLLIVSATVLLNCSKDTGNTADSKALAKVYDEILTDTEVRNKIPAGIKGKDSLDFAKAYVERWIRKQLLVKNAGKNLEDYNEIQDMVRDYKNSLIIESFNKKLLKEKLDTNISDNDLKSFYDNNKNNFLLENDMIRLRYAKINEKKTGLDKFYDNWNNGKWSKVNAYAKKNAKKSFLNPNIWYKLDSMKKEIPSFLQKNKRSYSVQKNNKGYEYFLKVIETRYKNENIPLELIKHKIKRLILQKRKTKLLDNYIEQLHKQEMQNKKIIIYS